MPRVFNRPAAECVQGLARALRLVALCLALIPLSLAAADTYKQKTTLPTLYITTFDQKDVTNHAHYKYTRIVMVNGDDTPHIQPRPQQGRANHTTT